MAFKDRPMRCNACGHRFFYTVAQQRQRAEAGMHDHTMLFCPRCKSADVVEAELSGFNPSPRDGVSVPARDEGPVDSAVEGQREPEAPIDDFAAKPRPDDTLSVSVQESEERRPSRGDRRGRGRGKPSGGRSRGGRGGRGDRGGRKGGGRGNRKNREPSRQTELRVRHLGTVKWFDDDRGYGFIAQDEGGEVFVHLSGLIVEGYESLMEGTPVEFEIERTSRGPQAVDVVPLA